MVQPNHARPLVSIVVLVLASLVLVLVLVLVLALFDDWTTGQLAVSQPAGLAGFKAQ